MARSPAVRVALAMYDALDRDDREEVLRLVSRDVRVVPSARRASKVLPVQIGHEGFREWWGRLDADGIRVRIDVCESWEVGDRAVCELLVTNEKGGRYDVARLAYLVTTLDEDGLVASNESFTTREEAFAAAGAASG